MFEADKKWILYVPFAIRISTVARCSRTFRVPLSALGPIATLEEFDRVADRFRDAADSPRERETALAC